MSVTTQNGSKVLVIVKIYLPEGRLRNGFSTKEMLTMDSRQVATTTPASGNQGYSGFTPK